MTIVRCKMCGKLFWAKARNRKFCDDCRPFRQVDAGLQYRRDNAEKLKEYRKKYYAENREAIVEFYRKFGKVRKS